jgi:D-alanine-D-alanine ligase
MSRTEDLVILFGGESSERRVSVATAQHLAAILPHARLWFWAVNGKVHELRHEALTKHERPFERELRPTSPAAFATVEAAFDTLGKNSVVFLALHGVGGEDGLVQGWLEKRKLCFTGSSAAASRCAFDKNAAKRAVARAGVRVPQAHVVSGRSLTRAEATIRDMWQQHGRAVVKPVADGSSHGLVVVEGEESFRAASDQLRASPTAEYLVEEFVIGREITVGVYDAPKGRIALPASEVVLDRGRRFDYEGKYLGQGTKEITPADLSDNVRNACEEVAIKAHEQVGCLGYSRTDMIVGERGAVFLEINNLPGLTRASFIPQQLKVAGIAMSHFATRQIALAKVRYAEAPESKKKPVRRPARHRAAED